jgi:hypothetical protein
MGQRLEVRQDAVEIWGEPHVSRPLVRRSAEKLRDTN